ncbi:MAG: amino acid adenylation domain-containing protein [Aquabacterium sp.]
MCRSTPATPDQRLAQMLSQAQPALVLTHRACHDKLTAALTRSQAEQARPMPTLLMLDEPLAITPTAAHSQASRPHHLAYVIFTSGSTGVPKGVMITHSNLGAYVRAAVHTYGLRQDDRVLQFSSISFDAAVEEIFAPLSVGACVVLRTDEMIATPQHFMDHCVRWRISVMGLPTAYWRVLATSPDADMALPAGMHTPPWRLTIIGGEAASPQAIANWQRRFAPHARLLNSYGPTETTVVATVAECPAQPATHEGQGPVSIGRPLPGTRIRILDQHMQPVPLGVAGEIHIGGQQVGRGYLGQPELSAERFVPDPFDASANTDAPQRLYKTGDIGRWREDGQIEHLGRIDHQVKLRGFRVELGEIETRLAGLPGVREAAVLLQEAATGHARLVAYVVPDAAVGNGDGKHIATLREQLTSALPDYMVPHAIVTLDALPLTINGKLDRRALPAPNADAYAGSQYAAPIGEQEQLLARIWSGLLSVPQVGRHDSFFDLGGHSLLVMQLIEQLRKAGWRVPLRQVFERPTLSDLATSLQALADSHAADAEHAHKANPIPANAASITPDHLNLIDLTQTQIDLITSTVPGGGANVQDIYPLAPLQEGILFHHVYADGQAEEGDTYILPSILKLDSRARLDQLLAAMQAVLQRHDILRTSIVWRGLPQGVQVVWRHAMLPVHDIALRPDQDALTQLQHMLAHTPQHMDLQTAPLLRAQIAQDPARQDDTWYAVIQLHHMVSDHVSQEIMLQEILACMAGMADRLPAPVPYRHFVAQALRKLGTHDAQAFFTHKLQGIDEPTAPFGLLDAHGHGAVHDARQHLPATLAQRVRTQSRRLGMSPAALMHAAWALVVARCSARDDIVFGSIVSGRLQGLPDAERVIGMFINTLPLRVKLQGLQAEQLVHTMRRELLDLLPHEQASLALAQRCSAVPGTLPLFTAVLNYRHTPDAQATPAWPGISLLSSQERTNYPFTLSVDDLGAGFMLTAQTQYDAAQPSHGVDPARVLAFMLTATASLVDALAHAPERLATELDVLPPAEWQQLLPAPAKAGTPHLAHIQPIHHLFEDQARRQPDAVALLCQDLSFSYAELNTQANRLARYLQDLGVAHGDTVAIVMPRCVHLLVAELAVLKAGACYVPIDADAPIDRQAFILIDSQARLVITDGEYPALDALQGLAHLDLNRDLDLVATRDGRNLTPEDVPSSTEDAAYIMYTSGSTGTPKGVVVPHRGVVRVAVDNGYADITTHDCIAHISNPAFDASTFEVWGAWLNGARLLIVDARTVLHPPAFEQVLIDHGVSVMFMTTALFTQYATALSRAFGQLKHLLFGGETLDPGAARRVLAHNPPRNLLHVYGPTETTTFATAHRIDHVPDDATSIPIGHVIAETQVHVLDAALQPAPIGVSGEIYIGGAGVALRYLRRPDLSAERFITARIGTGQPTRLYRTGDLGRWRAPGLLEYVGRNDQQVKIRGFRIEPGEIEAQLARLPGIREAIALAREDHVGHKRLVAYLTLHAGNAAATTTSDDLRERLRAVLPEYMVPTAFVILDDLPLTPNGKLDRRALPAPLDLLSAVTHADDQPQSEMEQQLAAIWQALLHTPAVRRHDNFFDIGGHSLLAVQLVARVREQLGLDLTLRHIFDAPTLSGLARELEALTPNSAADRTDAIAIAITHARRDAPLPLSWAQQRLWFLDQLDGASSAYVIPVALRLTGQLDVPALRASLNGLVQRHETLRTVFTSVDGQAAQRILDVSAFELEIIDDPAGRTCDPAELQAQAQAAVMSTPFDLNHGPLVRGRLVQLSGTEHLLFLAMHHIISDGWSMSVLVHEVVALYGQLSATRQTQAPTQPISRKALRAALATLPPLPIQYADYAVWQRRMLNGQALAQQADFWRHHLQDAPAVLALPTDHARPIVQSYQGDRVAITLGPDITQALKACAQRHGITLHMLLLSSWAMLMARLSGQEDVVIGTPVSNRPRSELEGLIGFFVNTLPLRVQPQSHLSLGDMLDEVKQQTLAAYAHQDLPFDQIVEAVQPPRSLSHSPVFQVLFSLNNTPASDATLPGLHASALDLPTSSTQFDLALGLQETGAQLTGSLDYATDLFTHATMQRWLAHWRTLLASITQAHADTRLADLAWLDASTQQLVQAAFNATHAPRTHHSLVHGLFEDQARTRPDAIALSFDSQHVSYAELDKRANQLARHLRQQGIGPEQTVALLFDRGIDMMVAVLGVLKAGAAYIPLDPGYPAPRLSYMLGDARPARILTCKALRALASELSSIPIISLDEAWPRIQQQADHALTMSETGAHARSLAYVIYTSGSTGAPKGVMVEHGGLCNLAAWQARTFGVQPGSRVLQFFSFSFDACVWEWVMALSHGATLCLATRDALMPGQPLLDTLRQARITHLTLPPVALSALPSDAPLPDLGTLIVAGEACPASLSKAWSARTRFFNAYGPTEATVCATAHLCTPDDTAAPPIGRPIDNTRVHILDAHGRPQPIGVIGELYIAGDGIARGYLNRPDLSAERFLPDPFAPHDQAHAQARMYRTGDLARWRADGLIDYIGRNDSQVKVRGFRIELGEIEAQLQQDPAVRDAIVLACQQPSGESSLSAYLVMRDGHVDTAAAVRARLRAALPDYMVPSAWVQLDALPLTLTGKIDKAALPVPDTSPPLNEGQAHAQPIGDTERALAAIWQEILQRAPGRHDNFFDAGGHSLAAVRLMGRIQAWGVDLPLSTLFTHPTVASLAQAVEQARQSQGRGGNTHPVVAVPLRQQGQQPPLFFVHDLSGSALPYVPLAQLLDGEQPVYGLSLQHSQQDGAAPQVPALPTLAAWHVQAIRQVQPHGPYRIAGWSAAGVLAYEIAAQLIGENEQVAFLGLIDSAHPASMQEPATDTGDTALLLGYLASQMDTEDEATQTAAQTRLHVLQALPDLEALIAHAQGAGLLPSDLPTANVHQLLQMTRQTLHAVRHYQPQPLPVPTHYFAADNATLDPAQAWRPLLGDNMTVHPLGGSHWAMLRGQAVKPLAVAMNGALASTHEPRRHDSDTAYTPIVTIQAGQAGVTPVICVPGAGANITCYVPLALALGAHVPVHGLQARGLDGHLPPHTSVEAAASAHAQALAAQGLLDGPCKLVGHSFGGWIAFELARLLQVRGHQVELLALLDSASPSAQGPHRRHHDGLDALLELVKLIDMQASQPLGLSRDTLREHTEDERITMLHQAMIKAGVIHARAPLDNVRGLCRVFIRNINTSYVPAAGIDVPLILGRASAEPDVDDIADDGKGWGALGPVQAELTLPGNHMTLLTQPHIDSMARLISGNPPVSDKRPAVKKSRSSR